MFISHIYQFCQFQSQGFDMTIGCFIDPISEFENSNDGHDFHYGCPDRNQELFFCFGRCLFLPIGRILCNGCGCCFNLFKQPEIWSGCF